jgi:hypothetical protein
MTSRMSSSIVSGTTSRHNARCWRRSFSATINSSNGVLSPTNRAGNLRATAITRPSTTVNR